MLITKTLFRNREDFQRKIMPCNNTSFDHSEVQIETTKRKA